MIIIHYILMYIIVVLLLQVQPDDFTYSVVMKAYGKLGLWQKALDLKAQISGGRRLGLPMYNNLLMVLAHNHQLPAALDLKAEMELVGVQLDALSYGALLQNACKVSLLHGIPRTDFCKHHDT